MICVVEGCDGKQSARGLCGKHYTAQWKASRPACRIPGCEKPSISRDLCSTHYPRWLKHGDPLVVKHKHDNNRVNPEWRKTCKQCGQEFGPPSGRSHKQWQRMQFCGRECASRAAAQTQGAYTGNWGVGTTADQRKQYRWQMRTKGKAWAASWEAKRYSEDKLDLAAWRAKPFPSCRLSQRPKTRLFIGANCACGTSFVAGSNTFYGSPRCVACTKRYWRGTHEERARRYGATYEPINPSQVFASDNWICQICGLRTIKRPGDPRSATLDHIVPLAAGGQHTLDNVQTAHARCNFKKGARAANDQLRLAFA